MSHPVYAFNGYVWELLKRKLNWTEIAGSAPIRPSDNRVMSSTGKPYLIYAFSEDTSSSDVPSLHYYDITYAVYSKSASEGNEAIHLLGKALQDELAASNVMQWVNSLDNPNRKPGVNIVYVSLTGTEAVNPPDSEGGYWDGYVMVTIGYNAPNEDFAIQ